MKCLDSDFLIAVLRGDKDAVAEIVKLDEEGEFSTTAINAYEILFGAKKSAMKVGIEETRKLLSKMPILQLDEKASEKASDMHAELSSRGQQIDLRDIFIAAIAVSNECKVVTRNIKDFSRIKGVTIEKW